jgi:hypothetical protein
MPSRAFIVQLGTQVPPVTFELPGEPVGVTATASDTWVLSRTEAPEGGFISWLSVPSGALIRQLPLTGKLVSIGGGSMLTTASPGAIVVLVDTGTGAEFRWFVDGSLDAAPIVFPLAEFPNAQPKRMRLFRVGGTLYAWVALLAGNDNVIALYNLEDRRHVDGFDVRLGTLEPLAVAVGIFARPPPQDPDSLPTGQTAFLHVLVRTN